MGAAEQLASFHHEGQHFVIVGTPTRWFTRRAWWANAQSAQRGVGAQVLEIEMLRAAVMSSGSQKMQFADLAFDPEQSIWQVVRVFE
jgi:hypothetical protein